MASPSSNIIPELISPLPHNHIVVGCGFLSLDFLATVAAYPKPDEKIRSTSFKAQGGGNIGNCSTCAARLGLKPKLISKVANDSEGKRILDELEKDGVDTSLVAVSEGKSPLTYVIIDSQKKTRTCITTPGFPPLTRDEISESLLLSALTGARIAFFDGKMHKAALVVAEEAHRMGIPILVDAERKKKGLDDLLKLSAYVICAAKFPQVWTEEQTIPSALVSMLIKLPLVKFVIATLGEDGCMMLERCSTELHSAKSGSFEEIDADDLFDSLKRRTDNNNTNPTCISSEISIFREKGGGVMIGRLYIGTAEKIPTSEVIDTTGAGDAFVGAILYAICANMTPEQMLPFAAQVAGASCRALGARTGLPYQTDSCLARYLQHMN